MRSVFRLCGVASVLIALAGGGSVGAAAAADDDAGGAGTLVFAKSGDIWAMHADGSGLTQLTTDPGVDRKPHWSPDGTQIAFASNRTGNFEIWVMNSDGSNEHQITHDAPENARDPSWTSDGTQLVYDVDFDVINLIKLDGSGERQLRIHAATPDVSPDDLIAFADQVEGDGGLYTMSLVGTDVALVSNPAGNGTLDPAWAQRGDRLAFVCSLSGLTNELCSVNRDGGNLISLDASPDRVDFSPAWSPNGKKVAFVGCTGFFTAPDCEIYAVKADGTHLRQITTFGVAAGVHELDWLPPADKGAPERS
jgi:Tol biopolymer transport system component